MKQNKLCARLKAARIAKRLSLRDIEKLTGGSVSNPYLCQLEGGKVEDPHPLKLRALANVLKLDFLELMILAGHLTIKDLKGRV